MAGVEEGPEELEGPEGRSPDWSEDMASDCESVDLLV
jgi:hypothetical protein